MNIIKTSKLVFLAATLLVLSTYIVVRAPSAFACSCVMPGAPSEALKEAKAVFSGTVTDIDRNFTGYGYKVKFDVEKVWKGISDKTAVVFTGMGGSDCGYRFKEGEKYFVYAYGSIFRNTISLSFMKSSDGDASFLFAHSCSRTGLLSAAGEDLSALGEGNVPFSSPNTPSGKPFNFSDNLI